MSPAVEGPAHGYLWRALTPSQCAVVREALASGVRARDLADAYGVSVRTVYRAARAARLPIVTVQVADWSAEYIVTDDGPVRCTSWAASPREGA